MNTEKFHELARKFGLKPYDVEYIELDYEDFLEIVSYNGFPSRYPHWRWGMNHEEQRKKAKFTPSQIYELVINDNPSLAYLRSSNSSGENKSVVAHVEAHSDFFANNQWFEKMHGDYKAVRSLKQNSKRVQEIMRKNDRGEVEEVIDILLCIENNIDTLRGMKSEINKPSEDNVSYDIEGISEEVKEQVFKDKEESNKKVEESRINEKDLFLVLLKHGKSFEDGKSIELEEWKKDIIRIIREESYYFAPQKMTKIMNEGWAIFYQSLMMMSENMAKGEERIDHSQQVSKVLSSDGLNPYLIGKKIWEDIEYKTNKKEILTKLLMVEGNNPENLDLDEKSIYNYIKPPDYMYNKDLVNKVPDKYKADNFDGNIDEHHWEVFNYKGICYRNFSFFRDSTMDLDYDKEEIRRLYTYIDEKEKFATKEEALDNINYAAGFDRMRDIRSSYKDSGFIDEFLTEEIVNDISEDSDFQEFKQNLLLQTSNFGQPTIKARDVNYNNEGGLLLEHIHSGMDLNIEKSKDVIERLFNLWGRPIYLKTKIEGDDKMFRYDNDGWDSESL
jgi:stage V sporulation protein R